MRNVEMKKQRKSSGLVWLRMWIVATATAIKTKQSKQKKLKVTWQRLLFFFIFFLQMILDHGDG